jgi:hypothetical protein
MADLSAASTSSSSIVSTSALKFDKLIAGLLENTQQAWLGLFADPERYHQPEAAPCCAAMHSGFTEFTRNFIQSLEELIPDSVLCDAIKTGGTNQLKVRGCPDNPQVFADAALKLSVVAEKKRLADLLSKLREKNSVIDQEYSGFIKLIDDIVHDEVDGAKGA